MPDLTVWLSGDSSYLVPEDAAQDRPPSYAAAQADSVPTYWDATTVHVPGGSSVPGEVIVEGLPTGSLFSFLWNTLISVSFQFVGFLLTYLLHTTHAAKFGSRAGLGVTLIQYGFALRRAEAEIASGGQYQEVTGGSFDPRPTFSTAKEAEDWHATHNATLPIPEPMDSIPDDTLVISDNTTEWLAFFLMTVGTLHTPTIAVSYIHANPHSPGWFVLLTSLLGYWRVKRWERSILSSTPDSSAAPASAPPSTSRFTPLSSVFSMPGLATTRGGSIFRHGLGLDRSQPQEEVYFHVLDAEGGPPRESADDEARTRPGHTQFVIDEQDPERADRATRALVAEQRLNLDLRAAGLL